MKIKFILFLVFYSYSVNAQVSFKVKQLAKPLDTISYAESSHIGIGGKSSKIYDYFRKVSKIAKNDELYYFAKNGSSALKLYSSQELFKRNDKRFLEIYQYYHDNPLIMKYQNGCIIEKESITVYLKNEVHSAKDIISLRDSLLQEKRRDLIKNQLTSIYVEGYRNLSQENLEFCLKEIERIDSGK
ncbi:hypothetical protein JI747_018785 [Chryseobacterium sp. RG1]|uniref:Uncharacterized protein n=1 Tax=Chryseobacterium tagetis TaxID=2801334 RepID=A0ABS8A7C9_9FLAO|nr:hypothetical protein [Chryseobacterium tagetis]MCA6069218.1 hypothetical protein [Chryseobacterium tagetis]